MRKQVKPVNESSVCKISITYSTPKNHDLTFFPLKFLEDILLDLEYWDSDLEV